MKIFLNIFAIACLVGYGYSIWDSGSFGAWHMLLFALMSMVLKWAISQEDKADKKK